MKNHYRVLLPVLVNGEYGQGDVFEHEFDTPEDELANVRVGLIEIVPRRYKVVGPRPVYETEPGDTFERALTMGEEAHLVAAGHVERLEEPKAAESKATKKGGKAAP